MLATVSVGFSKETDDVCLLLKTPRLSLMNIFHAMKMLIIKGKIGVELSFPKKQYADLFQRELRPTYNKVVKK
mgnify:CR=1 FL=1